MITCLQSQRIINLDFESYKLLPQYSFSFLKRERAGIAEQIKVTPKMQLGTMVDNFLTNGPIDMTHEMFKAGRSIAYKMQKEFEWMLPYLEKQVSYTGKLSFQKFELSVKGRPDFELHRKLILDLKICHSKNWKNVVEYMDYKSQQFNYAKLAGVNVAYLLIYCKPSDETIVYPLDISGRNYFWEDKILKFGTYVQ